MKSNQTQTASPFALPVVAHGTAVSGAWTTWTTWTAYGIGRNRTSIAPMAAVQGSALLPTSDVVVFDGVAGIRSWSPPV